MALLPANLGLRSHPRVERLQDEAGVLLLLAVVAATAGGESDGDGLVKDVLEALLSLGGALHGGGSAELVALLLGGLEVDEAGALVAELLLQGLVVADVTLGANEQERGRGAVVADLREPLVANVLERGGGDDRVAHEEDVGVGVGQRAQTVVVLLPGGIPKTQGDGLGVHHDVGLVVVKHGRHVLSRERVRGVRDEHARLADGSVSDGHALDALHCSVVVWW